jgi:hypothetical protein
MQAAQKTRIFTSPHRCAMFIIKDTILHTVFRPL